MKKFYTIFLITFISIIILGIIPNSYSQVELENIILACNDGKTGRISFQITNGSVTEFNSNYYNNIFGVIQSEENGFLIIEFDRSIFDHRIMDLDSGFFVFINNKKIPLDKINDLSESSNSKSIILKFPFETGKSEFNIISSANLEVLYPRQCEFSSYNIDEDLFVEPENLRTVFYKSKYVTYPIEHKNRIYQIKYSLHHENEITQISYEPNSSLFIEINSERKDNLLIEIPVEVITNVYTNCMFSIPAVVANNGEIYAESFFTDSKIFLKIPIEENKTKIGMHLGWVIESSLWLDNCRKQNQDTLKDQLAFHAENEDIQCPRNLKLIFKSNSSMPSCVKSETVTKLVKRGWATCDDGISHGRGHPCGYSSSGLVDFDKESYKVAVYPKFDGVTEIINSEHGPLKYHATSPVIDDTYLSKNVQQWKDAWEFELEAEYGKYGDEFYTELGRLLIKNEMQYQMNNLEIVNANNDFEVYSGGALTSLPPHIGFSAVINATDGNYYRLEGGTFANQVSYYRTTQLQFPDTTEKLSMESIVSKPQLITIIPENGHKARQEPHTLVVHIDNDLVEFFNNTPETIRIQDSGSGKVGEENSLGWMGPIILPYQKTTMTFDKPGLIEWDARNAPNLEDPLWWSTHAGGNIVVLSDDMNNFPRDDKARIAQKMLHNSDIPLVSSGAGNAEKVLKLGLDPAVIQMVPNAEEYYLKRAHQLIPFDVEIVMYE